MKSPMGPLAVVAKRLAEQVNDEGLRIGQFVAIPNLENEDGPHHIQAVFILDEENTPKPKKKDDEFEKMMDEEARIEQERRAEEARKGLEELQSDLKHKNKGLGLDD